MSSSLYKIGQRWTDGDMFLAYTSLASNAAYKSITTEEMFGVSSTYPAWVSLLSLVPQ